MDLKLNQSIMCLYWAQRTYCRRIISLYMRQLKVFSINIIIVVQRNVSFIFIK